MKRQNIIVYIIHFKGIFKMHRKNKDQKDTCQIKQLTLGG